MSETLFNKVNFLPKPTMLNEVYTVRLNLEIFHSSFVYIFLHSNQKDFEVK